jgi:hypothetical protein
VAEVIHAALLLAGTAFAGFCLRRAWQLGKGGFDEHGNLKSIYNYRIVGLWGCLGISCAAFLLLDLISLLNPLPSPPSMR